MWEELGREYICSAHAWAPLKLKLEKRYWMWVALLGLRQSMRMKGARLEESNL